MRIDRRRKLPVTTLLYALGHRRRGDPVDLLRPHSAQGDQARLAHAVPARPDARHQVGEQISIDAKTGKGRRSRPASKVTARRAAKLADEGLKELLVQRRRPGRPLPRRGHRQLCRPARSTPRPATRSMPSSWRRCRELEAQGNPDPRHRPCQCRRLHPQHARHRQELQPPRRRCSISTASCVPASRRRSKPPQTLFNGMLLRRRALRFVGRRPRQDEHAARPQMSPTPCARCARRTFLPSSRRWSACATARARSTTSTISATAGCGRSAS